MTKKDADKFLRWLYKFMASKTVIIRLKFMDQETLAEFYAYTVDDELEIFDIPIDPTAPILLSFLHEGLHAKYPQKYKETTDEYEERIEKLTFEIADQLTLTQWHNLFKRIAEQILLADPK